MAVRVYVIFGQFGWLFSSGMAALAKDLQSLSPEIEVTLHGWRDAQAVANSIGRLPVGTKVALIGNSLGANTCTQVAAALSKRRIELIVAYDASVLQGGGVKYIGPNVTRAICYVSTNYWMPFGHARLQGPQVETYETADLHVVVSINEKLHVITLAAVGKLL